MPESERFLSPSWYRIAALKPRLRKHVIARMHRYRGQAGYVVSDGLRNRVHRLSPSAYALVATMNGTRTMDQLWAELVTTLGEQAATQDQVIQLLGQLHGNDLIAGDVPPDARELFERQDQQHRSRVLQWLLNPLAMRIPLLDPNPFLTRTLPFVRPLFGWLGAALWLLAVLPALLLAARNWPELTDNIGDRALSPENLLLIAVVYPAIKLLHELGHGYATRAHGGEVHELGVMLLVLLPMPYVDVSASAGFRGKWTRCLVGAAGILVELFVAAVALYVWLAVEPGLVRAVAFNVLLAASVSSLLFNGNPLLRYDGYYVLTDAIEVPNLAQRGRQYWSYLARRYLFGTPATRDFPATPGERIWFLLFTPVSTLYRVTVTLGIALLLMSKYLAVGVILAAWGVVTGVLLPAARGIWSVTTSPIYARNRGRAAGIGVGLAAAALVLLFWLPAPLHTEAEGMVWLPDDAVVRAGTDGFVSAVRVVSGTPVTAGQVVVETVDPELAAHVLVLRGRQVELTAKLDAVRFADRVEAAVTETELAAVRTELRREETRASLLNARAAAAGVFIMPWPEDAPGRFVHQGDVLGYALPAGGASIIRATVSQEDIDLLRHHAWRARVRLADRLEQPIPVRVVREVPAGQTELPSPALGSGGGGATMVDPRDDKGVKPLNRVFQVDLEMPAPMPEANFGNRAYVRFDHAWEPLGGQIWRRLRQLLLSRIEI